MKNLLKKLFSFFTKSGSPKNGRAHKTWGQSMVEFALALPLLLILFSGMVEFGFMLNTYLSLLDATRQTARLYSNGNPFLSKDTSTHPTTYVEDTTFSPNCAQNVADTLAPPSDPNARQIVMDATRDDVLVSVLSISTDSSSNTITLIQRHPANSYYSLYGNQLTAYSDTDIEEYMTQNGTPPVQTGILIVEVYYGYTGILKLPWVEAFMSADKPVMLHASTIMPLIAAQP